MQNLKNSWKNYEILQPINYKNKEELQNVINELEALPPLVFAGEVRSLKDDLKDVCEKKAFLLHGGECAESFDNFSTQNIKSMLKLILQMAVVLTFASSKKIVKVGRIAGQFAKPRSEEFETRNGISFLNYRGDMINSFEFDGILREPDAKRMLKAYNQSASTINLLRAFCGGGFANLKEIHEWNLDFVKRDEVSKKFQKIASEISKALKFMQACGLNLKNTKELNETSFYTSHEALNLYYESALSRVDSITKKLYDCSAHMIWLGERTRDINCAHMHFASLVQNPIGVKISDKISADEILKICDKLNPDNEPGKLNFIVRMGANKIEKKFSEILNSLKGEGRQILWSSDPMHANTLKTKDGYKTREFDAILSEIESFFGICKSFGVYAGGIHLEMCGEDVSECIGGSFGVSKDDLKKRYKTQCDPRLNATQALELAFLLSEKLKSI